MSCCSAKPFGPFSASRAVRMGMRPLAPVTAALPSHGRQAGKKGACFESGGRCPLTCANCAGSGPAWPAWQCWPSSSLLAVQHHLRNASRALSSHESVSGRSPNEVSTLWPSVATVQPAAAAKQPSAQSIASRLVR